MNKRFMTISLLIFIALVTAACAGNTESEGTSQPPEQTGQVETNNDEEVEIEEKKDPVTLNFFYNGFSESMTNEVKAKIESQFPHITVEMIVDGSSTAINELLASGTPLDLASFTMGQLFNVMDLQLATDLTELMDKHQFDTGRLADGVFETVKGYSEDGEFLVMPYELNNSVMLYNKEIFDRFGLAYPTDGMTWDDVLDITRTVSREEDGVTYKGFFYFGANGVYKNQLGLGFVDPETNKATLSTPEWQRWLEVMTSFYEVENNEAVGGANSLAITDNYFFQDMTLALRTGPNPLDRLAAAIENGLQWDAVAIPVFPNGESTGSQMNAPFYLIPPTARDRDTSFEVIAYMMSDEFQSWNAEQGRVPIVNSPEVVANYGSAIPFLEGTNYANAIFNEKIDTPIRVTKYDGIARSQMVTALAQVSLGNEDVITALRRVQEETNRLIEEAMQ